MTELTVFYTADCDLWGAFLWGHFPPHISAGAITPETVAVACDLEDPADYFGHGFEVQSVWIAPMDDPEGDHESTWEFCRPDTPGAEPITGYFFEG